MKVCSRNFDDVRMILNPIAFYHNTSKLVEVEMPIGHFIQFDIQPTCGMANSAGMLFAEDDPDNFYHPDSRSAEIIWLRKGWVEYRFPKSCRREPRSHPWSSPWSCARRRRITTTTGLRKSRPGSTARRSAPGFRRAISATTGAS